MMNHCTDECLSYFASSEPYLTHCSAIVSGISFGSIYGLYIYIYMHCPILSDILSSTYSEILSDILSGIHPDILSDILSRIYSHILCGILSGIYCDILSGIYFDILSDILSGILFNICSDILPCIFFWCFTGHIFYAGFYLTFSLACVRVKAWPIRSWGEDRGDSARKTEVKEKEWGRPLLESRDPYPDLALFFFLNLLVSYFETYPCWRIS